MGTKLNKKLLEEVKQGFVSMPQGQPSAPPMDPSMAGGAPMDPSMMAGGAPMDPSMMAGGAPMDPSMAGGAPPMDPSILSQLLQSEPSQQGQITMSIPEFIDLIKVIRGSADSGSSENKEQNNSVSKKKTTLDDVLNAINNLNSALGVPQTGMVTQASSGKGKVYRIKIPSEVIKEAKANLIYKNLLK